DPPRRARRRRAPALHQTAARSLRPCGILSKLEGVEPGGDVSDGRVRSRRAAVSRTRLTADERVARGRGARAAAPRSSPASWSPAADRPDPVALLEEQAVDRVPGLVPIRYGRMAVSPLTFYRGAAAIMAADLAASPRSGLTTQLCGDAHLSNFGLFGSPERRL